MGRGLHRNGPAGISVGLRQASPGAAERGFNSGTIDRRAPMDQLQP